MLRYLVFQDGKSHKFWSIDVSGASFTVTYGKVGSDGRKSTKTFPSVAACQKEAEKLVNQKIKKGYEDGGAKVKKTNPSRSSKPQADSEQWKDRFAYLLDTDGYESVLEAVMTKVVDAKIEGKKGSLTLHLKGLDEPLIASPPAAKNKYAKYPKGFKKLAAVHESLSIGERQIFGEGHALDFGMFEEGDPVYELFSGNYKNVRELAYTEYHSTIWVYHPEEKNEAGELAIFPITHELENEIKPIYIGPGALALRLLGELGNDDAGWGITLPKLPKPKGRREEVSDWWDTLDKNWQKIFLNAQGNSRGSIKEELPKGPLTQREILDTGIRTLNTLGLKIDSLSPLLPFIADKRFCLEQAILAGSEIKDLTPLKECKKLFRVDLSNTPIEDVTPLSKVRFAYLDGCKALDMKTLVKLRAVRELFLCDTSFADLSLLRKLKNLERVYIDVSPIVDDDAVAFEKDTGVFINRRPDLEDAHLRILTECADSNAKKALDAGEKYFFKLKDKHKRHAVLLFMLEIAERVSFSAYQRGDKKVWQIFGNRKDYYDYMNKSGDFSPLRKKVDLESLNKDLESCLVKCFGPGPWNKRNLNSQYALRVLTREIKANMVKDVTLKDLEQAARTSKLFRVTQNGKELHVGINPSNKSKFKVCAKKNTSSAQTNKFLEVLKGPPYRSKLN